MWRYVAWDALHARGDFPGTFPEFAQAAWDVKVADAPPGHRGAGGAYPAGSYARMIVTLAHVFGPSPAGGRGSTPMTR